MKLDTFILTLFLGSLLLLTPMTTPSTEITVFTLEENSVIIALQGTGITITADNQGIIQFTISAFDFETNLKIPQFSGQFSGQVSYEIPTQGYYLFEFFAGQITTIEITEDGIPQNSLLIVGFLGILVALTYSRNLIR